VDTDDALLSSLISAVSNYIQAWLNRSFAEAQYTEFRDGIPNGDTLVLANYPVISVSSVTISGQIIPPSPDYVTSGFWADEGALNLVGYRMNRGRRNVQITYTAGYATVPIEIAQACTELVALRYSERDRIGHQSKSIAGETVSFMVKDFPPDVLTILQNYKKVVPI
jgi:hypothetical protein